MDPEFVSLDISTEHIRYLEFISMSFYFQLGLMSSTDQLGNEIKTKHSANMLTDRSYQYDGFVMLDGGVRFFIFYTILLHSNDLLSHNIRHPLFIIIEILKGILRESYDQLFIYFCSLTPPSIG